MIEFDPEKDRLNIAKHGISLERATDLEHLTSVVDARFDEPRFRAYGLIDDQYYCLAYTMRMGRMRVISLRRAHQKEIRRYAEEKD